LCFEFYHLAKLVYQKYKYVAFAALLFINFVIVNVVLAGKAIWVEKAGLFEMKELVERAKIIRY
jgi:hypothetical protein